MFLIYAIAQLNSTNRKVLFFLDGEDLIQDVWVVNSSAATEYTTKASAEIALAKIKYQFPNLHVGIL
ncbi:MAG: hypothetical protein PUP93_16215 [Rhizonema sp. NSF051]|nr:hypothetical protein [Rhizonema sp. NSF051]